MHAYAYVKREFAQLPAIDIYKYTQKTDFSVENGRERMSEEKTDSYRRINKRCRMESEREREITAEILNERYRESYSVNEGLW